MKRSIFCSIAALAVVVGLASVPVAGQSHETTSRKGSPTNLPRTPDGQPDIQGYWGGTTGLAGAMDLEDGVPPGENVVQQRQVGGESKVIVNPPDRKLPYHPWAAKIRDENRKNSLNPSKLEHLDSQTRCFQTGVPRMNFYRGFQMVQTPGFVFMLHANGSYRTIALDGRPHMGSSIKLWAGDSIGRWEGNTLVVDTANLNEHHYFDWAGNFHSDEARLVERWTVVDPDTIEYTVTTTDPEVFTRPWTIRTAYAKNKGPVVEQWEEACYEEEKNVQLMVKEK